MNLSLLAPFDCFTGYGITATEIARRLPALLGVDVTLRPTRPATVEDALKPLVQHGPNTCEWEMIVHPATLALTPGKKTIYVTMGESTRLPPRSVKLLNQCQAVIVPSAFCATSFSASGVNTPIFTVPLGFDPAVFHYRPMPAPEPFTFACAGRLRNGMTRKGVGEVIRLFQAAFPNGEQVRLKVKLFPNDPPLHTTDSRIEITRAVWDAPTLANWMANAHCFVNLATGGFELFPLQAMALGRPVISFAFGGITEFFNHVNGFAVRYDMQPATDVWTGHGLFARADSAHVILMMRHVVEHFDLCEQKGFESFRSVTKLTWENSVQRLADVLKPLKQAKASISLPIGRPGAFQFFHGLGDCANAALLWQAEKQATGMAPAIECEPDKAMLFQAAGCELVSSSRQAHHWKHPNYRSTQNESVPWADNKTAANARGKMTSDLWSALKNTTLNIDVPPESRAKVEQVFGAEQEPVVLLHSRSNNARLWEKSFTAEMEREFMEGFQRVVGGTLFVLDWQERFKQVKLPDGVRVLNGLSLPELVWAMWCADLTVGIDSGPLHAARAVGARALGVWFGLHPTAFALPHHNTAHVCATRHCYRNEFGSNGHYTETVPLRRHEFNLVDVAKVDAGTVLQQVRRATLHQGEHFGPMMALRCFMDRLDTGIASALGHKIERRTAAEMMKGHVLNRSHPVVVETGCVRQADDFGAGSFGYWMGFLLSLHGGQLHTVDITPERLQIARRLTGDFPVTFQESDSVKWLREFDGAIDLLYLDSMDADVPGHAAHCLAELAAALPKLKDGAMIVIDDTVRRGTGWVGKGAEAVPALLAQGWKLVHEGYQAVFVKP